MSGRVVIVGGGITGLATAHALAKKGRSDVVLLERGARLGGNIITERSDGFILDGGPDSWVAAKPQATNLAKDAGPRRSPHAHQRGHAEGLRRAGRRAPPLPEGLVLGVPTQIMPVLKTPALLLEGQGPHGDGALHPAARKVRTRRVDRETSSPGVSAAR